MDAVLFNGLTQEEMNRLSPADLAKMLEKMISDPEFFEIVWDDTENMSPEDLKLCVAIMKNVFPEEMAHAGEKMAKRIVSMRALVDKAESLKKQGNELHNRGKYQDAAQKYLLAKNNLKDVPGAKARELQLAFSLNLMSCYLNTQQFHNCIKEGCEVLAYDEKNVKALYRRGQAYKELGQLENAVSDMRKVLEVFPDAKTVAEFLREANESLGKGAVTRTSAAANDKRKPLDCSVTQSNESNRNSKDQTESVSKGPTTESECSRALKDDPDTIREANESLGKEGVRRTSTAANDKRKPLDCSVTQSKESSRNSKDQTERVSKRLTTESEYLRALKDDPDTIREVNESLRKGVVTRTSTAANDKRKSLDCSVTTQSEENSKNSKDQTESVSKRPTTESECFHALKDDLDSIRSFQSFISQADPEGVARVGSGKSGELPADKLKIASSMIGRTSPVELQNSVKMAALFQDESSSFNGSPFDANLGSGSVPANLSPEMLKTAGDMMGKMSPEERQRIFEMAASLKQDSVSSSLSTSQTNFSTSMGDMQEQVRHQMKDPATRQIFSSMLKNESPDMMSSMCEQFGLNLSKEDAAKAQAMMRWADRFQRVVEGAKKTTNWLPRRRGMVLILCMLILAIIIHFYSFIGSRAIHNLDKNPKSNPIQSELLIQIGFFQIWIGFGFKNFEN